jgi:hypothetical protein
MHQQQLRQSHAVCKDDTRSVKDQQQQAGVITYTALLGAHRRLSSDAGVLNSAAAAAPGHCDGSSMAHQQPVIMSVSGLSASNDMTGSSAGIQALASVRWQQLPQQQTHQQQQHAAYSWRAEQQQQRDLQGYDMRLHPAAVGSGRSFPGHTQAAAQAAANKTSSSSGKAAAAAAAARSTDSPGRHLVCNELLLESPPAVAAASAAAGAAVVSVSSMSGGSRQRSSQTERLKLKWRAAANTAGLPRVAGHTSGLLDVPGHTFGSRQYDQDMPPCGPTAAAAPAATDAPSSGIQTVTFMQLANTQREPAGQQKAMLSICSTAAYMTAHSQGSRLQSAAYSVNNSSCAEHVHHALMQQQRQQGPLQEMQQIAVQPAGVAAGAELYSTPHTFATAAAAPAAAATAAAATAATEAEARSGFVAPTVQGGAGSSSGSNSSSSEDFRTAAVLGIDELTLPGTAQPVTQQMSGGPLAAAAVIAERPSKRHRPVFTSRADRVDGMGSAANPAAGAAADVADRCLPSHVTDAWPGFSQLLQQLSAAVQQQQQQQQLGVHIGSSSSSHRFSTGALSAGGGVVTKQTANTVQQPAAADSSQFKDAPQQQRQQQQPQLCGASSFTNSLTAAATGQLLPLFQPAAPKSSSTSTCTAVAAAAAAGTGPAGRSPTSVNSAAGTLAAAAAAAGIAAASTSSSWLTQDGCNGQQQHTHLQQLLLPLAFPPFSSSRGPAAAAAAAARPAMSPHGDTVEVGPRVVPEQAVAHCVPHIMQQQQQQQHSLTVKQQQHALLVKQQHALGTDEWFAVSGLLMLADHS